MAQQTSVEGNKVRIDDSTYIVKPAGSGQFAVFDDFGGKLGYFTVNGKAVTAEDYGVEGVHPVQQIGKLWSLAQVKPEQKGAAPATKGVCRIAFHERPSDADLEKARAYRAWMKKQAGCKASYLVHDPATGKAMSISIWENRAQIASLKDGTPPDGSAALATTSVEIYPMVEEP